MNTINEITPELLKAVLEDLEELGGIEIKPELSQEMIDNSISKHKPKPKKTRTRTKRLHQSNGPLCMARVWKDENGGQTGKWCGLNAKLGDFCGKHGKEFTKPKVCGGDCNQTHTHQWQHLGRWDEEPPSWWDKAQWAGSEGSMANKTEEILDSMDNPDASGDTESILKGLMDDFEQPTQSTTNEINDELALLQEFIPVDILNI